MGKEIIVFGNIEIKKRKFHHLKKPDFVRRCRYKKYRCLVWFLRAKKKKKNFSSYKMMIIKLNHFHYVSKHDCIRKSLK